MATLWITEYESYGGLNPGRQSYNDAQVLREPAVTTQAVTYTTATDSAAFDDDTNFVRLVSDTNCHVRFGGEDATTGGTYLPAGFVEYFAVPAGITVSVITAS